MDHGPHPTCKNIKRHTAHAVDGECSDDSEVKSGVPQGTVSGPLMFILYKNDISAHISSSIRLFANDCVSNRVITGVIDAIELQTDLNQMYAWAKIWQMVFNASKCTVLTVAKKASLLKSDYTIGGQ